MTLSVQRKQWQPDNAETLAQHSKKQKKARMRFLSRQPTQTFRNSLTVGSANVAQTSSMRHSCQIELPALTPSVSTDSGNKT